MARWYDVTYANSKTGEHRTVTTSANTRSSARLYGRWKLPKRGRKDWYALYAVFNPDKAGA